MRKPAPELPGAVSGPARSLSWPRIAAVMLPIVGAVLYGVWSWNGYQAYYGRLDASGVETQAAILSKFTGKTGNERARSYYEMRVEFSVDNKPRRGNVRVTRGFYRRHDAPDRVPIRYLPEDPQIRELDPTMRRRSVRKNIVIVVTLLFIGLANAVMGVGNEGGRRARAKAEEQ